jgi:hypothetical protein
MSAIEPVILSNGQTTATLYCADCLDVLPTLGKVDAVITDPPYGLKIAGWDSDMPPQEVLSLCLDVARGPVMWFGSASRILDFASYTPRPDRILIWAPAFSLSRAGKDGYTYRYHPIALWRPVEQTAMRWDVIKTNCEGHHWWNHPATKPEALMMSLVTASGGQSILDPFMGSGTTGVACAKLGRNFIGIELDSGYFDIAVKRIKAALAQPSLFGEEIADASAR